MHLTTAVKVDKCTIYIYPAFSSEKDMALFGAYWQTMMPFTAWLPNLNIISFTSPQLKGMKNMDKFCMNTLYSYQEWLKKNGVRSKLT